MKILAIFLLLTSSAFAKSVSEPMTVIQVNWAKDKKMYRLTMLKHAAVYWAPKKLESCLLESMNQRKDYVMSFDTKNMQISDCKKLVSKK